MREFFHEKLQRPIEFFNPLHNVTVADSVALEEVSLSAHFLGELVGLALRSTMTCPMELNLRPAMSCGASGSRSGSPFFVVAGVVYARPARPGVSISCGWRRSRQGLTPACKVEVDRMRALEGRIGQLRKEMRRSMRPRRHC